VGIFRELRAVAANIEELLSTLHRVEILTAHSALEGLKSGSRYEDSRALIPYGQKVYSQNDEDGIIAETFRRIGTTNKTFVEFGVGKGLENNTLALLFDNWRGLWIECAEDSVRRIRRGFENTIANGMLSVIKESVNKDNINDLISSVIQEKEIDFLSVDIDGNDFHVFDSISCVNPRVVAIEYNGKFPPPVVYCMKYDADHVWRNNDNYGASLKFLEIELAKKGYCLVGCNLTGVNAFFVRKDLVGEKFLKPFTAEVHYEPLRLHLAGYRFGHRPSSRTLENSISAHDNRNK
jgi:hypothetical protein